jgi:hypothetical protein
MRSNLNVQGYCLSPAEVGARRIGLRFAPGVGVVLGIVGMAIQSPAFLLALAAVWSIAGWTPRHPLDLAWNHGVRRLTGEPTIPPNPARRRHAFKAGTVSLLVVGALLLAGQTLAAVALGTGMVVLLAMVTATHCCVPSILMALWDTWSPRGAESNRP